MDSAAAVSVEVVGRNLVRRSAYAAAGSDGTPSRSAHLGFCSTYLRTRRQNTASQNRARSWGDGDGVWRRARRVLGVS